MSRYLLKRLLLLPFTLFFIILINFVIVNMAPGDPTTFTSVSADGSRQEKQAASPSEDRYLQFREFFGLTKPILLNTWTYLSLNTVKNQLYELINNKKTMSAKDYDALRIKVGDESRYVMKDLLEAMKDPLLESLAIKYFIRGAYRIGIPGYKLTQEERAYNRKIEEDQRALRSFKKPEEFEKWYQENREFYNMEPTNSQKIFILFFDTRFSNYLKRVFTLDFGVMRNDPNKTVISEVAKRFKYSLTLALTPLVITFILSFFIGILMAYTQGSAIDQGLNFLFLILYAIPVFVVAPWLIEKVALHNTFFFTDIPIPLSGFSSPESAYSEMTSKERFLDVVRHLCLPMIAILYGSLAAQSRLSRTAVLEVMRKDYVRTAVVKGCSTPQVLFKHVGRNSAITLITSIAGSLGVVLGGSLIVETLFEIDGFGKFFYDAILNRDYNVVMFSALAGSFLTLTGYLISDIAYMLLDPRVSLYD